MQFLVALITRAPVPVLLAACLTAQTAAPPPSYRFSANGAASGIPVEVIANGLVLVHAKVNDHPGWFIVDSAVQGFVAHRVLVVIDLKSLEPAIGHRVDGIIGSRLFDDFVVLVDYQRGSMSVYEPERYQPSGKEKPLPIRVDQHGFQFIEVTVVLPGATPITGEYLIDSGANSYLEIYKPFCDEHRLPPPAMKLLDAPGTSAGTTTKSTDGRADRIEVGSFSIRNPPISFGEDVAGLMASKDHAGLIGAAFLQRFVVVYDSRGKRILLAPNRSYR